MNLLSDTVLYDIVNVASRSQGVRSSRIQNVIVAVPIAVVPEMNGSIKD